MDTSEWVTVKKGTSLKAATISPNTHIPKAGTAKKDSVPKPTVSYLFRNEDHLK